MKDLTPKEKANELVNQFTELGLYIDTAKQCALIAVDEMIYYLEIVLGVDKTNYDFYYDVKSEIEKL